VRKKQEGQDYDLRLEKKEGRGRFALGLVRAMPADLITTHILLRSSPQTNIVDVPAGIGMGVVEDLVAPADIDGFGKPSVRE